MHAIILSIGDELTLGQTLNSNSQWIAQRLAERSIITIEHRTLADDESSIATAIVECTQRSQLLIITGGLGPTDDDLTREALGSAVAPRDALVQDQEALGHLQQWFTRRGRKMPTINLKQALRPQTFRCLPNPHGTAPGLAGKHNSCLIFCLPGPPHEMQPMLDNHVLPALPEPGDNVILTGAVRSFGMGESVAAEKLGDLMRRDRNPLVGTTVSASIVTARIRAQGPRDWARQQLDATMNRVREAWHPYAFADGDASLSEALGVLLQERGLRLATAESCTGGWLGKSIVDRAGSSAYYIGGWITYSNQIKSDLLDVPEQLIAREGAVSADVAAAMASGAKRHSGADCALAITGIAGPEGGNGDKPVGTVYIAAMLNDASVRRFEFPGDRDSVRDRSVKSAMQMLRFALLGVPDAPLLWEAPELHKPTSSKSSTSQAIAR